MSQEHRIRIDQRQEIPLQRGEINTFAYRYAHARSADSQRDAEPGQDYLVFSADIDRFTFAACDGVSQSFFGNIAAQILGDGLDRWLANDAPAIDNPAALSHSLTAYLSVLTSAATKRVNEQIIPDEPAMLHDVLLEKQERGSEAMFVCGRIDSPTARLSGGRILLAWMGDMRVYVWQNGSPVDLGGVHATAQRWSSRHGPIGGGVNLFYAPLSGRTVVRLVVYSDGLKTLDGEISRNQTNEELNAAIRDAGISPESDDITYLEVVTRPSPLASFPATRPEISDERVEPAVTRQAATQMTSSPQDPQVPALLAPSGPRRPRWASWFLAVGGTLLFISLCGFLWWSFQIPNFNGVMSVLQSVMGTVATPTETATATPTETATATPTGTATATPTETATATPTEVTSPSALSSIVKGAY